MAYDNIDYDADHYCPVYQRIVTADLCYESLMCLNRSFKVSSVKELNEIKDIEEARKICGQCIYSEL